MLRNGGWGGPYWGLRMYAFGNVQRCLPISDIFLINGHPEAYEVSLLHRQWTWHKAHQRDAEITLCTEESRVRMDILLASAAPPLQGLPTLPPITLAHCWPVSSRGAVAAFSCFPVSILTPCYGLHREWFWLCPSLLSIFQWPFIFWNEIQASYFFFFSRCSFSV